MITDSDLEKVAMEQMQPGDTVVSKTITGQPNAWQVKSKKIEYERDGQIVTLKPKPSPGATHVAGVRAPLGILVHRVKRR
jgi:hypothetical protein